MGVGPGDASKSLNDECLGRGGKGGTPVVSPVQQAQLQVPRRLPGPDGRGRPVRFPPMVRMPGVVARHRPADGDA